VAFPSREVHMAYKLLPRTNRPLLSHRGFGLALTGLLIAGTASAQRGDVEVELFRELSEVGPVAEQYEIERATLRAMAPERIARTGERPTILMTGYWPPTNEMLRQWSTDPTQNPEGWAGENWEGRGYDIHSFFPEFSPPDCNFCGQGEGDLEVDYQDTSMDFNEIASEVLPIAVITFSRGFNDMSWEVELNQFNRAFWVSDYESPFQPTPAPPDAGVPAEFLRLSGLPLQEIVDAVDDANLGLNPFICTSGDGGAFLSEFAAYHGVWYHGLHASPSDPNWTVAGGHVHVGQQIDWDTAEAAAEVTLRTVLDYVDSVVQVEACQEDIGFSGPGTGSLSACGDLLDGGGTTDLLMLHGPPEATAWVVMSETLDPVPFRGGTLAPNPPQAIRQLETDFQGRLLMSDIAGGGGPLTRYVQVIYEDATAPEGFGFSNTIALDFLP